MTTLLPTPGLGLATRNERLPLVLRSSSLTAIVADFGSHRAEPFRVANWYELVAEMPISSGLQAAFGFFDNGGREAVIVDSSAYTLDDSESLKSLFDKLSELEDISLIVAPGAGLSFAQAATAHCEALGDRMLIVDSLSASELDGLRSDFVLAWSGAVKVRALNGKNLIEQSAGALIAGALVRSERERGISAAPVNISLHGVQGLARARNRKERDADYKAGLNLIQDERVWGGEVRLFGAQTSSFMSTVSARSRLAIARSIAIGTRWAVGEPGEPKLWASVREQVEAFCERLREQGILKGSAREAYSLKIDGENNPREAWNQARENCVMVIELALAFDKPGDFQMLRIHNLPSGPEFIFGS